MKTSQSKFTLTLVCASALLTACASQPQQAARPPGVVKVFYSQAYPDGSLLKEIPTEVTIVKRETTASLVGAQVALNIFTLAVGGGIGFQGFSKDGLKGTAIVGPTDRASLKNPVADTFIINLQASVNDAIQADASLRQKTFNNSLTVAGGSTRLVYETLADTDEERFRLKTDLIVFKKKESAGIFSFAPLVTVKCENQSPDPLAQREWAENNYQLVKDQIDSMYTACQKNVLAELHNLLKD